MKIQQMDKKQAQQAVILGVVTVAVVIYGVVSNLPAGGDEKKPEPKSEPKPEQTAQLQQTSAGAPSATDPTAMANLTPLPPVFTPDPFKPAMSLVSLPPAPKPLPDLPRRPAGDPAQSQTAKVRITPGVPSLPGTTQGFSGSVAPEKPKLPTVSAPTGPQRPLIFCSGVIAGQGGNDLALVEVGTDKRVVTVGEVVAAGYKVKEIAIDGVRLYKGKDSFFVLAGGPRPDASKGTGSNPSNNGTSTGS